MKIMDLMMEKWIKERATPKRTNVNKTLANHSIVHLHCGGSRLAMYNIKQIYKHDLKRQSNTTTNIPLTNPTPFPIKLLFQFENHPT